MTKQRTRGNAAEETNKERGSIADTIGRGGGQRCIRERDGPE